jgi:hypothetical protein
MIKDNRKSKRRPMRLAAWIANSSHDPTQCVLSDISNRGARIKVEEPDKIPDRFILLLARNGAARRFCHVVWRQQDQIGVSFETARADPGKTPVAAAKAAT